MRFQVRFTEEARDDLQRLYDFALQPERGGWDLAERMLDERRKDGCADVIDEGAVKAALALARHMKEQLSERDRTSGRLELGGTPSFHALTRAELDAMVSGHVGRTLDIARSVLADAGNQPGLVVAVLALHAPAFAEGFALLVKT